MAEFILFEKVKNPEFEKVKDCRHPEESRFDYHDGAILCKLCHCIISQFGEIFDEPTPLAGDMPSEFVLKEVEIGDKRFLHSHPFREQKLGLAPEHVIVDKDDWDKVMKIFK